MENKTTNLKCTNHSWSSLLWIMFFCSLVLFSVCSRIFYFDNYNDSLTLKGSVPLSIAKNLNDTNYDMVKRDATNPYETRKIDESDSCLGRYIYVHDLPSRFNADMIKNCSSLLKWQKDDGCASVSNMGLGPPVVSSPWVPKGNNWYYTNQFMLEMIFHNRMKQYECITNNSSVAAAIYVPFYPGLDVGRYLWGFNTSVRDSTSVDLLNWLTKQPEWNYMNGKDHFLVAGRPTWDFRRQTDELSSWGNKLLISPEAKNMSILIIESCPLCNEVDNAIPYPTVFHPSSDLDIYSLQEEVRHGERQYLYTFVGGPRSKLQIRRDIIAQCSESKGNCKWYDCSSSDNNCDDTIQVMKVFRNSRFCLQPPGDSATRRSTFDSILSGCIPVFFRQDSAYTQYLWHLPQIYSKYSVFIPEDNIKSGRVEIEEILGGIPEEEVLAMREEVVKLIPRVVYANPMSRLVNIEDAFDIAVKGVIDKVGKEGKEQ